MGKATDWLRGAQKGVARLGKKQTARKNAGQLVMAGLGVFYAVEVATG